MTRLQVELKKCFSKIVKIFSTITRVYAVINEVVIVYFSDSNVTSNILSFKLGLRHTIKIALIPNITKRIYLDKKT
jgi:hypothetical protein